MKKISLILLLSSCFINAQTPIYKFEFNASAAESSNSSIVFNTYQASGNHTFVTDRFGNANSAVTTVSNSSTLDVNLPNLPLGNATRSISVWIKVNLAPNNTTFNTVNVFNYGTQQLNQSFGLQQSFNRINAYGWSNDALSPMGERFGLNPHLENWIHYVMTFDGANVKVYRNGTQVISDTKPQWNTVGNIFTLNGSAAAGASAQGIFYDDLEIYDVVLTEQQIKNVYLQQVGSTLLDDLVAYFSFDDDLTSTNGNHTFSPFMPNNNGSPTQEAGFFGNGYRFHFNVVENTTLHSVMNTDNISICYWTKKTSQDNGNFSEVNLFNGISLVRDGLRPAGLLAHGTSTVNAALASHDVVVTDDILNLWVHHALVFEKPSASSATRRLHYYMNGILVRSLSVTNPMFKYNNKATIGRSFNNAGTALNNFFTSLPNTVIDELMIFNKPLTQTEILALRFMDADALSQLSCPTGNVTITSQAEADALAGCTHITGDLSIEMNNNVLDFTPLQNITTIDGSLYITELGNTGVLNILPNLTTVGGAIAMYGNSLITSVEGFSSITSLGGLVVSGSFNLTTFNAFQNLQSVNYITVNSCQNLTTIQPFSQLAAFNNLRIEYTALTNLNFLSNVSTVLNNPFYNAITLFNNNNLSDISALNNLTASGLGEFDEIVIQNNPLLATCAVDLVCSYLASPDTNKIIANNATGCETVAVVNAACEALSNTDFTLNQFSLYPNPSNSIFNVEVVNDSVKTISVVDLMGKVVAISNVATVDVSNLASGLYLVQIQTESGKTGITKLIKN